MTDTGETPEKTPLNALHRELGGKMVAFAGYDMPVQYPTGIIKEHQHTRAAAGLFDVSHMGQARLHGEAAATAMEALVPGDLTGLAAGRMRYTFFTNETGGILDDLMVTRRADGLFVVVNAACKDADFAHMAAHLGGETDMEILADRALLALQGPQAAAVLARHAAGVAGLPFMSGGDFTLAGAACFITRSGYTGEDGFEISLPADAAEAVARLLLTEDEVLPIGLGARDSLRLEAGLCLYGTDIDETTTPVEAGLTWAIAKRRREEGGFPGAAVVQRQWKEGVTRKRVGLRPEGRAPARAGTEIVGPDGTPCGRVTSGGFGPTVGGPIAMGYVDATLAAPGTQVGLMVRGKPLPAGIVNLPFVPKGYAKET